MATECSLSPLISQISAEQIQEFVDYIEIPKCAAEQVNELLQISFNLTNLSKSLECNFDEQERSIKHLSKRNKNLKTVTEERATTYQELEDKLNTMELENGALKSIKVKYEETIANLLKVVDQLQTKSDELEKNLIDVSGVVKEWKNELQRQASLENLNDSLLLDELHHLKNKLKMSSKDIQDEISRRSSLVSKLNSTASDIKDLEEKTSNLTHCEDDLIFPLEDCFRKIECDDELDDDIEFINFHSDFSSHIASTPKVKTFHEAGHSFFPNHTNKSFKRHSLSATINSMRKEMQITNRLSLGAELKLATSSTATKVDSDIQTDVKFMYLISESKRSSTPVHSSPAKAKRFQLCKFIRNIFRRKNYVEPTVTSNKTLLVKTKNYDIECLDSVSAVSEKKSVLKGVKKMSKVNRTSDLSMCNSCNVKYSDSITFHTYLTDGSDAK